MKREVLEEAGLECEPDALISVEYSSRSWVRFTFTGMFSQRQLQPHVAHIQATILILVFLITS